ncbi:MAG: hypothetical protein GY805_34660 [Chloroflexi bacterium]|nr:hypothetical protein [Chloroflexota bacterium]
MNTAFDSIHYQSYLLRLGQVDNFGVPQLRITLIHVASGQKKTFTTFEQLAKYLEQVAVDHRD